MGNNSNNDLNNNTNGVTTSPIAADLLSDALSSMSPADLFGGLGPMAELGDMGGFDAMNDFANMGGFTDPEGFGAFSKYSGEEEMTLFRLRESKKQVRRFYLTYPAKMKDGTDLRLYIEVEIDEDDDSYVNYWVGCEEHTTKQYIASVQRSIDGDDLLDIVKVKHIQTYVNEIVK